jgi:environmental stress-induced protein Ves
MQFNIIPPSEFKTVSWKNGKGSTKELLFENIDREEFFAWRLSMAPVTEDGPFSDFSGYHRTLILIEGNGIELRHNNGQTDRLVRRFDFANFDGGWITEAILQQGKITDFNVMTRQGVCAAKLDIFRENGEHQIPVNADHSIIYPLDTAVEVVMPGANGLRLAAKNLLRAISPSMGVWKISGKAVICVQISYLHGDK